ncbi:hypothetical protein GCM10011608_35390 [Micromonospora sonchi]|uniref:Insertion element IS402-like domain-containing protein n=1 Tax=Micromonospora sonchi TaxID=1763543 RepID=A0A917X047_9ACTN|nr:hypothetical protein GCM10011608_35390 [Micromonospora sonchi]
MVDAILYVVRTGCSWRQLPVDFPPWQTVYWYFIRWEEDQVTERILVVLRRRVRAAQGRAAEPTAGIIDSQSVKGAETVGQDGRGWSARVNSGLMSSAFPSPTVDPHGRVVAPDR